MVCERARLHPSRLLSYEVLILVLMEYGLRVRTDRCKEQADDLVLILVLMEYGLRATGRW